MLKYDKEKLKGTMESFMKSPTIKKQYEEAPSDECQEYLKFTFYSSDHYDPDGKDAKDYDELQEEIEKKLAKKDWEYLKGIAPNSPFVGYCNQKIKELER